MEMGITTPDQTSSVPGPRLGIRIRVISARWEKVRIPWRCHRNLYAVDVNGDYTRVYIWQAGVIPFDSSLLIWRRTYRKENTAVLMLQDYRRHDRRLAQLPTNFR